MSWHPGGPVGDPHQGPGFSGRNRSSNKAGPSGIQRSSASQLKETEPLFDSYEHLQGLPRGDAALSMLRKIASMVKPIMRKHGWRVRVLAEFLPPEQNLLGLNINKGFKICIRLRYHNNPDLFLPLEEVVDTMLHELSHNVWGEHDSNFHKLWDELRDEHEALIRKGYTGEGFLGGGKRLGGSGTHRSLPLHEMRQRARASAEKRQNQAALGQGSGRKLGGTPLHLMGGDVRGVIASQVTRRNTINKGCGSGRKDAEKLSQDASNNTFKTKAEEDDANNRAIAQALMELMEDEEERKLNGLPDPTSNGSSGLAWSAEKGLYDNGTSSSTQNNAHNQPSEEEQMKWAMQQSMESSSGPSNTIIPPISSPELRHPPSAPPVPASTKPRKPDIRSGDKRKQADRISSPPSTSTIPPIKHEMLNSQTNANNESERERDFIDLSNIPDPTDNASEDQWVCEICTLVNPMQFLSCDACGVERPPPSAMTKGDRPKAKALPPSSVTGQKTKSEAGPRKLQTKRTEIPPPPPPPPKQHDTLGWSCARCGAFMEHQWFTCSACGSLKQSS